MDTVEIHHLLPKTSKERNNMKYIWLIHKSCHDQLHANTELLLLEDTEKYKTINYQMIQNNSYISNKKKRGAV